MNNLFFFDRLYHRLGKPRWYWQCVIGCVFVLYVLGSSITVDALA